MLVALLSDIHDHTTHLLLAVHAAKEAGCTHMLFMGDMTSISSFRTLREEWEYPVDLVFGNNEYQLEAFYQTARQWKNTTWHGFIANVKLDGRNILFCHFPWEAAKALQQGCYDAVFYGHTHKAEVQTIHNTLLANPGDVYGRTGTPSFGIYDTRTNSVRIVPL